MKKTIFCFWFFTFSSAILSAQIPTYFNLRERLTENGNPDGPPIRDALLALKVSIFENETLVFEESHPDVKTNYDGYISIKVGDYNPSGLGNLDWQNTAKTIKIESRLFGSSGPYKRTYEDKLPVAAFAQLGRPSNFIKPSGVIQVFPDGGHPGIELRGNTPEANFPYIDFSAGNADFLARLNTYSNNFIIESKGGIYNFSATALNTFRLDGGPNNRGEVQVFSNHDNAGVEIKGIYPYVDFGPWGSDFNARIALGGGSNNLDFSAPNGAFWMDAPNGVIINKGGISVNGGGARFNGEMTVNNGKIIANAGIDVHGGAINVDGVENWSFDRNVCVYGNEYDLNGGGCYLAKSVGPFPESGTFRGRNDFGILTDRLIKTKGIVCPSDIRIKKNISILEQSQSIDLIKRLSVKKYLYSSVNSVDTRFQIGFIAQDLEKVIPDAISLTTSVIPNINSVSKSVTIDENTHALTLVVDSLTDVKAGEKLRILGNQSHLLEVAEVNGNTIVIKDWPEKDTKEVFVYGKEVDDFRVVDYNRIFTLNVSATQALIQEVEDLKNQVVALEKQNQMLQSENADLKTAVQAINGRIDALAKAVGSSVTTQVPAVSGTH